MKYLLDNNLSPYLARGIQELILGGPHHSDQVKHLRDKFPQNTPDHIWINELSREGGWSIISQDGFRKNDVEKQALRQSGLVVFVLAKQWAGVKYWDKAQNLVRWWPYIEEYVSLVAGGAAVKVPWRCSGKFEQIKI